MGQHLQNSRFPTVALCLIILLGVLWPTTVILNSLEYEDIISSAVYARANGYNYVFALTPNQSVFLVQYYTQFGAEPIIYMEGKSTVLPNMEALLRDAGPEDLTVVKPDSIVEWVADQFPRDEAIIVGSKYGQDSLSVAPYAALTKKPIFFIGDDHPAKDVIDSIKSKGYSSVLLYGSISRQIPKTLLDTLPSKRSINLGSRFDNNLEIVKEFLALNKTSQVIMVSGKTFEKSMIDKRFPIILVGRSTVTSELSNFIRDNGITSAIVFNGDADIVDGVTKLRAENKNLAVFAKFGEGYVGSSQPLPLMVIPLPAPKITLEIIDIEYNIQEKVFEVTMKNTGDFISVSTGVTVPGLGSADSPLTFMEPGTTTTIGIPMDASTAISNNQIPEVTLTLRYGEDSKLLDNIDTITYQQIGISNYTDDSSISLLSVTYNSQSKAFELVFEGNGWVQGTVRFTINDIPILLRIPPTKVSGRTTVPVKYLLSIDEQSFIDGQKMEYSLRYGGVKDIMLKSTKGNANARVEGLVREKPSGETGAGEFPLVPIAIFVVIALIVIFVAVRAKSADSGFE